jgi:hypothetical protein
MTGIGPVVVRQPPVRDRGAIAKDAGRIRFTSIARLKETWIEEHARRKKRDLPARRYVYVWADGVHGRPGSMTRNNAFSSWSARRLRARNARLHRRRESAQDWRDSTNKHREA